MRGICLLASCLVVFVLVFASGCPQLPVCGGVQGIPCPEGFTCEYPPPENGSVTTDAFGTCVEVKEKVQACGGIAGIACPEGFVCTYDDDFPDAMGKCVELKEKAQACGGIAGIACPDGYACAYEEGSPIVDNVGKCVKATKVIECGGFTGVACPDGFECAYSKGDEETIHPDSFGECVPASSVESVAGECELGRQYDARSSVGCACPDGYWFKRTNIGYFREGNIEAPIPGVECVRIKQ